MRRSQVRESPELFNPTAVRLADMSQFSLKILSKVNPLRTINTSNRVVSEIDGVRSQSQES